MVSSSGLGELLVVVSFSGDQCMRTSSLVSLALQSVNQSASTAVKRKAESPVRAKYKEDILYPPYSCYVVKVMLGREVRFAGRANTQL